MSIAKAAPHTIGSTIALGGSSSAGTRGHYRPGMVWLLAWRNLASDRVRFAATLVGIAFAVVLMAIQWGLLIGFANTAAGLIDHAGADFWVASRGTSNVDQGLPVPERWRFQLLSVPGVAAVDPLLVQFAPWKRPDGRSEYVIVVGYDLASGIGAPWNVVNGSANDLHTPDTVILDRLYAEKLGISAAGQSVEIGVNATRARVVGFTDQIRAFTQSPYVFTSFKNAHRYARYKDNEATYLLVRAAPGVDRAALLRRLREALPVTDVWSSASFASMTAHYWMLTTGAGLALLVGAGLGVVVGIAIVAQTLYAATVERLPEYATLIAMGAPNRYLNQIVLRQGLISGIIGYAIGIIAAVGLVYAATGSTASLELPWQLATVVAVTALTMCALASLVAIDKIKRIDPTMVFR